MSCPELSPPWQRRCRYRKSEHPSICFAICDVDIVGTGSRRPRGTRNRNQRSTQAWLDFTGPLAFSCLCLITAVGFVIRTLRRQIRWSNFGPFAIEIFQSAACSVLCLVLGLFGSVYLMPVFLAYVRAHNALEIGKIMLVTGVAQLAVAPLAVSLVRRVDDRLLTGLGFLLFAIGLGLSSVQTRATDFDEMFWPQLVRGSAIMLCILPPTQLALGQLAKTAIADASGLFNLMRNLGGAIGIAIIDTVIYTRAPEYARTSSIALPPAIWILSRRLTFHPTHSGPRCSTPKSRPCWPRSSTRLPLSKPSTMPGPWLP